MPAKKPGDRRIANRRKLSPERAYLNAQNIHGKTVFGIDKIVDSQSGKLRALYRRKITGQVTTNTRINPKRRTGIEERRTGKIERRTGTDRRKAQIGKASRGMIMMSRKEFADSNMRRDQAIDVDKIGNVFVHDQRKKDRRETKGKRATDNPAVWQK